MNPNQHINRLLLALNENLDNPAFIQHDLSHTKTDQFFTCIPALILTSLEHTPKTAELNKVGTKCLRLLQSQQGSRFSYTLNKTQSYPFDIDDTSVALLAKWSWKQTLTSTDLFQCLQDLIQLESVPGGPYRTWLVNTEDPHWQDIDPVANLNIGRFLASIDLLPKSLLDFLITTWSSQASSRYYPNHVLPLYFLSDFIHRVKTTGETSKTFLSLRQETLERCTALLNSTVTIDEEITLYLALFKLDSTLFSPYENRCIELITNLKTSKTSGLILCLDQDHKNKQLLCSRAITIAFAIELMSLILMNQGKNHHNRMSTSLHEQCSALLYQKLENTPEPIKSLIHSVTSSTFLDTENTLWNLAECCDLDQPSHIETAMVVHLDGWILGTLLNTVIDDQNIEKKQSRSKDVLLTALYLWHSSLIHLQTLEHELPLLKQFSRGLPEKTLLAWIREKQQIKQFREDRAIGHLLLYLSTCDQKKFSLFKRATLIALEAFQMSDDLKDLTLDFPDTPPLELEKQRAVIVQRLDQLSSAFADLVQYELPYLRSSLHLLHQRAKLDILLADVIRKFNLQKSDHNRNS